MPSPVKSRELLRFLGSGFTAVFVDIGIYFLLLNWMPAAPSKAVSFVAGTTVAYLLNKYWTFSQPHHSRSELARFTLLYLTTLSINVLINQGVLTVLGSEQKLLGFLCATGTSTVLNFIGQKFWVFRPVPQPVELSEETPL